MLHALLHRKTLTGVCISIALAFLITVVVWAVGGHDSTDSAPSTGSDAGHAHSHPSSDSDVDDVADRVVTLMFSWEPVVDASSADALTRAVPWLADPILSTARTPNPQLRADPSWAVWRRDADIVTASAQLDDGGTTTASSAYRYLTVTQRVQHLDSTTTPLSTVSVRVDLSHTNGGWRVSQITPIDSPTRVSTPQEGNPS